ncbi:MAG: hypothetical protein ACI9RG_001414, partial [Sulfurimonas sp.]
EYGITDELTIGAIFINVDAQATDADYNKYSLTATYSF